ncbi:MAG: heavy metal translocating P-type ATPase [Chloroflexota bacterium]
MNANRLSTRVGKVEDRYQLWMRTNFDPLFGTARNQQLVEMTEESGGLDITPYEKTLNRNIAVSVLTTGLAITGRLVFLPLQTLCIPLVFFLTWPLLRRLVYTYRNGMRARFQLNLLSIANSLLIWGGGFFVAGGIASSFLYLSEKLIIITQDRSHKNLVNVFGQQPRTVWAIVDDVEVEVPFEQIEVGDTIVLGAGQMIPIDGVITRGHASIDQHRLTGESQPAERGVGDAVLAATVVLNGQVHIRVEKAGEATLAAQIGDILNNTASYQMSIETKAFQVALASFWPTILGSALAAVTVGMESAAAITNSFFGINIKITSPIAMLNYLNLASRKSILVKDGRSLELLNEIDTVVFDKTGTLTLDMPNVTHVYTLQGIDKEHQATEEQVNEEKISEEQVLAYAAALEQRQSHPIAQAILNAAAERSLTLFDIDEASYEMGYGIRGRIDGHLIRVGSDRFMDLEGISIPSSVEKIQDNCHAQAHSLVMVAVDDQLVGAIELEPTIRPEAKAVVDELHKHGKRLYIISGDQEQPTRNLARSLGIEHYFANTLPADKAKLVEQLQSEGRKVCFVGDGINDSIALKKAQVSISLRGATTIATDTAQIVFMDGALQRLPELFDLARSFDVNMRAGFATAIIPGLAIFGGVFLFHLGVIGSVIIFNIGLMGNLFIATLPALADRQSPEDSRSVSQLVS